MKCPKCDYNIGHVQELIAKKQSVDEAESISREVKDIYKEFLHEIHNMELSVLAKLNLVYLRVKQHEMDEETTGS
jgi:hypothetical protein